MSSSILFSSMWLSGRAEPHIVSVEGLCSAVPKIAATPGPGPGPPLEQHLSPTPATSDTHWHPNSEPDFPFSRPGCPCQAPTRRLAKSRHTLAWTAPISSSTPAQTVALTSTAPPTSPLDTFLSSSPCTTTAPPESPRALPPIDKPASAYFSPYRVQSTALSPRTTSSATLNECCAPRSAPAPRIDRVMGLSKSQRIGILLAIDTAFFLVEITIGYAVHSLALVADSFHMLNDVLSLCVGLWAVRIANTESSKMYTYGWQRAETLGALVNGVFLVALCLSIFLEAIQRFVEPQEVSNPRLVLIVGCLGLASNILGLFLFHDHGHSHGGGEEEHGHSHSDPVRTAEEGHAHAHDHTHADGTTHAVADPHGSVEDVLPQVRVAGFKGSDANGFTAADEDNTTAASRSPSTKRIPASDHRRHRRTSGSFGRGFGSVDNIQIHPASFRQDIISAGRLEERSDESDLGEEDALLIDQDSPNGIISPVKSANYGAISGKRASRLSRDYSHVSHHHNQQKDSHAGHGHGGHGHSHGDLNMRGVFLHVMGDALGNVGVIASALIIWLTTWPGRFYSDPAISLIITVIILYSAIPLCKAASRILLQAVPVGMSIDEITADIEALPRVIEAHHLHVWQLSDTKLVASLHVKVDCDVEGAGSAAYMHLAREIRSCLHGYGIHSSTIQPEFTTEESPSGASTEVAPANGQLSPKHMNGGGSKAASLRSEGRTCLLDCADTCADSKQCCPAPQLPPDAKKK